MYKVLIVDDEYFIRKGLKKIILKEKNFDVIGTASNGIEAIELIKKEVPDIVITDIKMPKMDGIKLISNINTDYPDVKTIILSGFDEFEFVRKTLRYGAHDYILKPVDDFKLISTLNELSLLIEKTLENELNRKELNRKSHKGLEILREKLVHEVVTGYWDNENLIKDKLKEMEFDYLFEKEIYNQVIVVRLDNYEIMKKKIGIQEADLNLFIIRNIVEETVTSYSKYMSCFENNSVLLITPYLKEHIKQLQINIINNLNKYSKNKFTIAVGSKVMGFKGVYKSYNEAKKIINCLIKNEDNIVLYEYIENEDKVITSKEIYFLIEKYSKRFINLIEMVNSERVDILLDEIFEKIEINNLNKIDVIKLFRNIYILMQVKLYLIDEWIGEIYGREYCFNNTLGYYSNLNDMKKYLKDFFVKIIEKSEKYKSRRDTKLIENVKKYIDKNYNENITLSEIAEITYLNPNYFCEFFKEEMNQTFVDYLTNVRIDKAKEILKDERIKIYEISDLVGYNDSAYFCRVFKKIVGVTPTQYRENYKYYFKI
ncbi:MAG: response regulator [Clostridiales bacterium]